MKIGTLNPYDKAFKKPLNRGFTFAKTCATNGTLNTTTANANELNTIFGVAVDENCFCLF